MKQVVFVGVRAVVYLVVRLEARENAEVLGQHVCVLFM